MIVFGIVSSQHAAPDEATIPTVVPSVAPPDQSFDATFVAQRPAIVTVTVDGQQTVVHMKRNEQVAFAPHDELTLVVAEGGTVQVTIAGTDLGAPGEPGQAWQQTFTYEQVSAWPSPSPSGSPSSSASGTASP
jgi:hypothetical protein